MTTRALVRKYPECATNHFEEEVWLEDTWQEYWEGFLNENMHYALCENVPDEPVLDADGNDLRRDISHYTVTEHTEEVPSEEGTATKKHWTAVYNAPQ